MFTKDQIAALNAARTVLAEIASEAQSLSWNAPMKEYGEANPADYGRVAGLADAAEWDLFQILNTARAHRVAPDLTEDEVHNRKEVVSVPIALIERTRENAPIAAERRENRDMHERIVGTFSQLARELDEITQAWSHSVKV